MPIVPLRELFTGQQPGGGPTGTGTTDGSASQVGPLAWNPARRKPRSDLAHRVRRTGSGDADRRAVGDDRPGQGIDPAFRWAGPHLCGLPAGRQAAAAATRAFRSGSGGDRPPAGSGCRRPPPARPSRRRCHPCGPWRRERHWRPGRSVFRGLPAAVASAPPLVAVAVARPSRRGSPGFASTLRFPAGIARPLSLPPRADPNPDGPARECSTPGRPDLALAVSLPDLPSPPRSPAPRQSAAAATTRQGGGRDWLFLCPAHRASRFRENYIIIYTQIRGWATPWIMPPRSGPSWPRPGRRQASRPPGPGASASGRRM